VLCLELIARRLVVLGLNDRHGPCRTPLHRASSPNYSSAQGNPQVGYLLLRIGGEPLAFAKDEQGNTALHLASFSAEDSVAKLLVLYFPGLLLVRNKKGRSVASKE
jgi:ankyrin repeat protein